MKGLRNKSQTKIAIIILFAFFINFFISPVAVFAQSIDTSIIDGYIKNINEHLENAKTTISASNNYEKALQEVKIKINNELLKVGNIKNIGISLQELIKNDVVLMSTYSICIENDILIKLDNINDIYCDKDNTQLLINENDIINLINTQSLNQVKDTLYNYDTNFNTILNAKVKEYDDIDQINANILEINPILNEIENKINILSNVDNSYDKTSDILFLNENKNTIKTIEEITLNSGNVNETLITSNNLKNNITTKNIELNTLLVSKINIIKTQITNTKQILTTDKDGIVNYIDQEKIKGNKPIEIIDNANIVAQLENLLSNLDNYVLNIDETNILELYNLFKKDELASIDLYDKFFKINFNIDTLKNNIINFKNNYQTIITSLENWYDTNKIILNITDEKDIFVENFLNANGTYIYDVIINNNSNASQIINDLFNILTNINTLEVNKQDLMMEINDYYLRNESTKDADQKIIDELLNQINIISYNMSFIRLELITTNFINMLTTKELSNKEIVNKIYYFLNGINIKNDIIDNARLAFYKLTTIDSDININNDYIIMKHKSKITKEVFNTLFTQNNGIFDVTLTNNYVATLSKVTLKDENNILVKEYKIIIVGDISKTGITEEEDINLLVNEIANNNISDEALLKALDVNQDNEINVTDLVILYDTVKGV